MVNHAEITAEKFLREKLESEISSFGDGMAEFHTRDIELLLHCLDEKDEQIVKLSEKIIRNARIQ